MDNTGAWWHNTEVVEGLGAPLKELEALLVTLKFHLLVELGGIERSGLVDLDGMINNKIDGAERVNLLGVATNASHAVSHGSQIDDGGHTSEVLEDDTSGAERYLSLNLGGLGPVEDGLNIGLLHLVLVAVTDGGLEENSDGVGELLDAGVGEGGQVVVAVGGTGMLERFLDGLVEGVGLGASSEGPDRGLDKLVALGVDEFLHIGLCIPDYLN